MLSRRDRLLLQPWEQRRFKDHRNKVTLALPAIDDSPPATRPHVVVKFKKLQKENDRQSKIENDNFSLLQRLNAIMKVNRLDNHWQKPLPNFQNKVGLYFTSSPTIKPSSIEAASDCGAYRCYACELRKRKTQDMLQVFPSENTLPPIHNSEGI